VLSAALATKKNINMKAYYGNIYANVIPTKTSVATTSYKMLVGYFYGNYDLPSIFKKQI